MKNPRLRRLAKLAVVLAVPGCNSENVTNDVQPAGTDIRVINGAPDAVRVRVDGTIRAAFVAPSSVSPAIIVPAGSRTVVIEPADGSILSGSATTDVVTTSASTRFVTARAADGVLAAGVVSDSGAVPQAGKSKLRVIHMASGAPPIDVWRTQPDFAAPTRMMFPFPYGAESSYVQSDSGIWEIIVAPAANPPPADPRPTSMATLAVFIGQNNAATVVIFDASGGWVRMQLLVP